MGEHAEQRVASEFADIARRYRAAIDAREGQPVDDFLLGLHPLLCELIYRASALPDLETEGEGELPKDRMTHLQWKRLYESLSAFLGKYNLYWQVFDPVELCDDDPMYGTLADDLADIYRDVGECLKTAFDPESPIPTIVIWSWRFQFFSHWGFHALGAARTVHAQIGYHHLDDPELRDEDGAGDEEVGA